MIVKIQQSQTALIGGNVPMMLIYNETRKVFYESELSDEVKKLLNKRPKAYFEARIVNKRLQILREVQTQIW